MKLITAVAHTLDDDRVIPAGSNGEVIDVIIEDNGNHVMFLLDFEDVGTYDWYEPKELQERF